MSLWQNLTKARAQNEILPVSADCVAILVGQAGMTGGREEETHSGARRGKVGVKAGVGATEQLQAPNRGPPASKRGM